jgi:O-methyltransferase
MSKIERSVTDLTICEFYHIICLKDGTITPGVWDLRSGVDKYLGGVDFRLKRVIEIGPASGFLSFHMEGAGAKVTCIEPPMNQTWDYVPQPVAILEKFKTTFSSHIQHIRNGFWYCHTKNQSSVALYEEDAYALPSSLGRFDIGLLGAILLHTSSPLKIIESVASLVDKTLIIVDLYFSDLEGQPISRLAPGPDNPTCDTWWQFSTLFFVNFLWVIGFQRAKVTLHQQRLRDRIIPMFTVVADR